MKAPVLFACFALLFQLSHPAFLHEQPSKKIHHNVITMTTMISPRQAKVGLDLCKTCIEFTGEAINELLNIILNAGVIGTCGELCGILADKTGSKALGAVCDILCSIAGVEVFVKLIQEADLDPIYFCELLNTCGFNDYGDANITNVTVLPQSGPRGTNFLLDVAYVSKNGTGTGEIGLDIQTVDGIPVGGSFLNEQKPAGTYGVKITIKAAPDPGCDPTQEPCERWLRGNYVIKLALCYGECGSRHPHSKLYDQSVANFTITN